MPVGCGNSTSVKEALASADAVIARVRAGLAARGVSLDPSPETIEALQEAAQWEADVVRLTTPAATRRRRPAWERHLARAVKQGAA